MELLPEWAPNIHPLIVHFPIAILLFAALINLLTFFIPEKWWDETKNTVLYVAGSLAALVTYYTGQAAADSIFLPTKAQPVLSEHADWAFYLLWFFILYAVLRFAFHWFGLFEKKSFKIIAFITVLPGLFMVYETAEYGGEMVFGYGAGTGQLLQTESADTSSTDSLSVSSSSFEETENGNWTLNITQASVSDLVANFRWLEGSVHELEPVILQSEDDQLQLNASDQPNTFVTTESYQNVQVDYYLNLERLSGEVELIHHVQGADNYDFVSLDSNGSIQQGRMRDGEITIFEESTFNASGQLFVRVVADGTHFRGYVNQELLVHGHGDAPESGSVGLKLEGNGNLLISEIEMTQL